MRNSRLVYDEVRARKENLIEANYKTTKRSIPWQRKFLIYDIGSARFQSCRTDRLLILIGFYSFEIHTYVAEVVPKKATFTFVINHPRGYLINNWMCFSWVSKANRNSVHYVTHVRLYVFFFAHNLLVCSQLVLLSYHESRKVVLMNRQEKHLFQFDVNNLKKSQTRKRKASERQ